MEAGRATLENELVQLYDAHAAALLRYAAAVGGTTEQARDAVQETFLRYFAARRYGRLIEQPRAWLFQVLRNYLINCLASAGGPRNLEITGLEQVPDTAVDPESLVVRRERAQSIAGLLTPHELDCLRLRVEGLSYAEIADVLHVRPGTVGALLTKIHVKLRSTPERDGKMGLGTASAIWYLCLELQPEPS